MGNDTCSSAPPDARGSCPVCRDLGPIAVWLQCYGHPEPPVHDCSECGRPGVLVRVVAAGSVPQPVRGATWFRGRGRRVARRVTVGAAVLALAATPLVWQAAATDAAEELAARPARVEPSAPASVQPAARANVEPVSPASVSPERPRGVAEVPAVAVGLRAGSVSDERIAVDGTAELPDGARLMYVVTDEAWRSGFVDGPPRGVLQGDFVVRDGQFGGELDVRGFGAGRLEVYVAFHSIPGGGQPQHVSDLYGAHGERIHGPGYTADGGVPRVSRTVSVWR